VPRRKGAAEIIDLDRTERAQLIDEIADASRTQIAHRLRQDQCRGDRQCGGAIAHSCDRARFHADAAWPKPVWNAVPARD
jgi:hypothetical protein